MSEDSLSLHFGNEVAQSVRFLIKIRLINLLDISCEDNLGSFPCSRDNGFDFMRRKVLSFIDDEVDVG